MNRLEIHTEARKVLHTAANSVDYTAFQPVSSSYTAVCEALDAIFHRLEGVTYQYRLLQAASKSTITENNILDFFTMHGGTITAATLLCELRGSDILADGARVAEIMDSLVARGMFVAEGPAAWREITPEEWSDGVEAHQQYRFEVQHGGYEGTFEEWLAEPDPEDDPEYIAYCEEMSREYEERGELAGAPREMACHPCHLEAGNKPDVTEETVAKKKVVKLGPVAGADPTQTYELECGHVAF